MLKKVFQWSLAFAVISILIACKSEKWEQAEQLADLLSVDGNEFVVKKAKTKVKGFVVLRNKRTGEYVAFNIKKFDPDTMRTADDYLSQIDFSEDRFGNLKKVNRNHRDLDPIYKGHGMTFEHSSSFGKDLELLGSLVQQNNLESLSVHLEEEFGLSSSRSNYVARQISSFQEVSSESGEYRENLNVLLNDVIGSSYDEVLDALDAETSSIDNGKSIDDIVKKASRLNAISPEQIRSLIGMIEEI